MNLRFILHLTNALVTAASGTAAIAVGIAIFLLNLRPWGIGDVPVGLAFGPAQFLGLAVLGAGATAIGSAIGQTVVALRTRRPT